MNEHFNYMIWKENKKYVYTEEFINFLEDLLINKGETINSISSTLQISYSVIKNIAEENGLFVPINTRNPKFNPIYQNFEWCYQKFMTEGLNHEEMAKESNTTKRTIEKWCTEKHRLTQKYRQKNKQLNRQQKDLIIGSLLGDGHIDKRETQPIFIVSHAEDQKDYLFWKYDILKDLCNIPPTYHKAGVGIFGGKEYKRQASWRISSRIYDCFIPIREMSVIELLDNLNEMSFCIAILDDGHRGNLWEYCIAPYSDEEKEYMLKIFKNKFNLNGYIRDSDNRYMIFNTIDSKRIDNIILNNIPNNLDIIQNKIINNKNIRSLCNYRMVKMKNNTECGLTRFCKINNIKRNKGEREYEILCDLFDSGITDENNLLLKYKEVINNE